MIVVLRIMVVIITIDVGNNVRRIGAKKATAALVEYCHGDAAWSTQVESPKSIVDEGAEEEGVAQVRIVF